MIILTGDEGFIGKKFLEKLSDKNVIKVEKRNSWHFRSFTDWNKVELILHQGAISDTTCTNLKAINHFNVEFTQWLFEQAIKYEIPIKYASSASVYGNTSDIINKSALVGDTLLGYEYIIGIYMFFGSYHKFLRSGILYLYLAL